MGREAWFFCMRKSCSGPLLLVVCCRECTVCVEATRIPFSVPWPHTLSTLSRMRWVNVLWMCKHMRQRGKPSIGTTRLYTTSTTLGEAPLGALPFSPPSPLLTGYFRGENKLSALVWSRPLTPGVKMGVYSGALVVF